MLALYKPKLEELFYKESLLADSNTMSYNQNYGGTIAFPEEKWNTWYEKWLNDDKHFYRYLINENNEFVGEIAYHFENDICLVDVLVEYKHRHKGYGKEALLLLIEETKKVGIREIYDKIAFDNPAIKLFISCGFKEVYRNDEYVMMKKEIMPI